MGMVTHFLHNGYVTKCLMTTLWRYAWANSEPPPLLPVGLEDVCVECLSSSTCPSGKWDDDGDANTLLQNVG